MPTQILLSLLLVMQSIVTLASVEPDWNEWLIESLLQEDVTFTGERFDGQWSGGESWKGYFCHGSYSYNSQVSGWMDQLKLDLNDKRQIHIRASVKNVSGTLLSEYQSDLSLCFKLADEFPFQLQKFETIAIISLDPTQNQSPLIRIRILSTRFGRIHFREARFPRWLEVRLQQTLNQIAQLVWGSSIGEWLSDRLSHKLGRTVPFSVELP